MNAWLIKNKYIISDNFHKLCDILLSTAMEHGINLNIYDNISVISVLSDNKYSKPDFVLFWDKDVKLASYIESKGIRLFNKSEAIKICDDKSLTYLALLKGKINMPKTIFSPLIYYHSLSEEKDFINFVENHLGYPFVYKECFGSFGQQVYLINNNFEFCYHIKESGINSFICQEYIKTSIGRDLRLYVVGDKVLGAMRRENKKGDFRANIELGGVGSKYLATDEQINMAKKVTKILDLDFAGVDILFGENDKPILCEVNSNAYFVGFNNIIGINVADYIFDYIKKVS